MEELERRLLKLFDGHPPHVARPLPLLGQDLLQQGFRGSIGIANPARPR